MGSWQKLGSIAAGVAVGVIINGIFYTEINGKTIEEWVKEWVNSWFD